MSQNYGAVPPSTPTGYGSESGTTNGSGTTDHDSSGKAEAAKQEAADVKDTAMAEAGHVVETAKEEVSTVAQEAKAQAKQVYAQTRQELTEQAATQQQRVADGLRSIGDELQAMARGSENRGMATELVEQASSRLTGASSWLSDRDPGSLMNEVKSFARRKPGMFIAGALVAGLAAGRLTRALAENAKDERDSTSGIGTGATGAATTAGAGYDGTAGAGRSDETAEYPAAGLDVPAGQSTAGAADEATPMYDESRAANPAGEPGFTPPGEANDGR